MHVRPGIVFGLLVRHGYGDELLPSVVTEQISFPNQQYAQDPLAAAELGLLEHDEDPLHRVQSSIDSDEGAFSEG